MRLDRWVSQGAWLSRSSAQIAIRRGEIEVDGAVVRDPSFQLDPSATVTRNGEVIGPRRKRYIMLNKPAGYVCTRDDTSHPTVFSLLRLPGSDELHAAGRLDTDTTGLVLLTDDGAWSHRITAPRRKLSKVYRATLAEPIDDTAIGALEVGVLLRGESKPTRPASVEQLDSTTIRLTITEGRYHQVKRMLAAAGNRVVTLHRERIGSLSLDPALAEGAYRDLATDEIALGEGDKL